MGVILTWATPEDTDTRRVRIDIASTKAGTYTAVTTIDATSDGSQKGLTNTWVTSYVYSAGTSSDWFKIVFLDSNSATTTSDAVSEYPNVGRPYGMLQAGEHFLKHFAADTWDATELELAQDQADDWIEGELGVRWSTSYVPKLVVRMALMYGSATLITYSFVSQSPNESQYAEYLYTKAQDLMDRIKTGKIKLEIDSNSDGIPDSWVTLGTTPIAESGTNLKKFFDATKEFHDQSLSRPAKDSDADWY